MLRKRPRLCLPLCRRKVPAAEAYAGAKAEAEKALTALATLDVPEALEASLKETMTAARSSAERRSPSSRPCPPTRRCGCCDREGRRCARRKAETAPEAPAPQHRQRRSSRCGQCTGDRPSIPRFDCCASSRTVPPSIAAMPNPFQTRDCRRRHCDLPDEVASAATSPSSSTSRFRPATIRCSCASPARTATRHVEEVATISIPENATATCSPWLPSQ